jgi:guanylate kinase
MIARRGLCLVLAAPSGAGKSSLSRAMLAAEPNLALSVSATTRPPRPGEQQGVHYFFQTREEFAAMEASGGFFETAEYLGRRYGTPRVPVEAALAEGRDVLFDIDCQGHGLLRAALPRDVVGVFILPPSMAELERRLRTRAQDSDADIARRLEVGRAEIARAGEFDHVVVNTVFDETVAAIRAILAAARTATPRLTGLPAAVAALA